MTDNRLSYWGKMFPVGAIPFLAVAVWIILAGYGIWTFAAQETEPPAFDVLTYAQKAYNFWNAVAQGHLFNPMNLEPTSRPFGTVLMSYPFGFSQDFRFFYFRSMFIPLVLLAAAVLCAVPCKYLSAKQRCLLCAAAIVLASAPALFQFRYDAQFSVAGSWGLVDLFLSGVAALAFGVLTRFAEGDLAFAAIITALLSVLCFLIKPAGLLVMALTALFWFVFSVLSRRRNEFTARNIGVGTLFFLIVYGVFVVWSFSSAYLSAENLQSARKAFTILKIEADPFDLVSMLEMIRVSIGIPVVLLWCVGFLCALRRPWRILAFASFIILLSGGLFWLAGAHFSQVRYFLPFAFAATIVILPALIDSAKNWSLVHTAALITVLLTPSFGIGAVLMSDIPPGQMQKVLGINLTVNKYAAEVRQARDLLAYFDKQKMLAPRIYFSELASPVMAFQAVIDSAYLYSPTKPSPSSLLSVDWARGSAYRMDELASSRFIVFEPVPRSVSGLSVHAGMVATYQEEGRIVKKWLSSLGENDGIRMLSETSVRVIEIVDRSRFESAVEKLATHYQWRPLFLSGYGERWLSAADISSERRINLLQKPLEMRTSDGSLAAELLGIFYHEAAPEVIVDIWLKPRKSLPASAESPWFVFFHALNEGAHIQQAPQSLYIQPSSGEKVRQYRFRLPFVPESGALGVYRPGAQPEFLITDSKDWNGRRVLFSMQEKPVTGRLAR